MGQEAVIMMDDLPRILWECRNNLRQAIRTGPGMESIYLLYSCEDFLALAQAVLGEPDDGDRVKLVFDHGEVPLEQPQ